MSQPLVNVPGYLRAMLDDGMLRVYRSPVVRESDRVFEPVAVILRRYRHAVVLDFSEPSADMQTGTRHVTVYQLTQGAA